ncbi:hypothetical protein ACS0TY_033778 [Phlomoides rotata]
MLQNPIRWNAAMIRSMFDDNTASLILSTPLSSRPIEDWCVWNHTTSGKFTVHFAYFLAVERFSKCGKNLPSASSGPSPWKKLWALKIPPKISHFLWRACNEALPSLCALKKRGLITPTVCPSCGLEPETTSHILLRCPIAIHTWGRSPLKFDYDTLHLKEFLHLFWEVIQNLPMHGVILFVAVAWILWKARNKKWIEQEEMVHPKASGHGGQWAPPPNPSLKLNTDAGVFPDNSVGLGFIVHDWRGQPILAGTQRCSAPYQNCTLIEALALRFGVSAAASRGLRITAQKTDSQSLALALQGKKEVDDSSAMIVEDILGGYYSGSPPVLIYRSRG